MRKEKDSMGEVEVPDNALWGASTARAMENFQISGTPVSHDLILAYAQLKKACAQTNEELGLLKPEFAKPILAAIQEILNGKHADQFVVDQYQAGAGTSTNMNLNEVIARLAGSPAFGGQGVSPNDHVNMGQSTNDTYPSAMRIAIVMKFDELDANLKMLEVSFGKKGKEFKDVIKSARTHLQDAVPITLGQEFIAYAKTIADLRITLELATGVVRLLGIGGSAAGTGLNAHPKYAKLALNYLHKNTGYAFMQASDLVESMQSQNQMLQFASALKLAAVEISRIASDLRLLSSGPNTGFAEIKLPAVQPGSSIMPGKINPSILECVNMVCYRVMGAETAVTQAVLGGQLNLNVNMPLMASEILHSMTILSNAVKMMAEKCVDGITADIERNKQHAYASAGLATALNPIFGYAAVADLVKEMLQTKESLPEIVARKKLMSADELKKILK